jgi:hypothetical protein
MDELIEDGSPFQEPDSLLGRVGRPGWDWHDDRKPLREGIGRVYLIGAGASACHPYCLPTLKTLAFDLYNFVNESERMVLADAIYESLGVDLAAQPHCGVDFEELLNRLDPRALQYLSNDPPTRSSMTPNEVGQHRTDRSPSATHPLDIALDGLRNFLLAKCSLLAEVTGPYDRLVRSITEQDAIVSFNWDVLLELAFRRNGLEFAYWDEPQGPILLKPHGSINWFALLDREMLSIDQRTNWGVFANRLTYYMLYLRDPLGSRDLGGSSLFAQRALSQIPAIIPPVASRILAVGGKPRDGFVETGHWNAMNRVWAVFSEFIRRAEELVVIGYSLPGSDAASIKVLKQFAREPGAARGKKVMIVDRNPQVLDRYRRLVYPNAILVCDDFDTFDPSSL